MNLKLYDWPQQIIPRASVLVPVGAMQDGFISRASLENNVPIPGGRNQVRMEFNTLRLEYSPLYSWLTSNAYRAMFRLPIWSPPQLPTTEAIQAAEIQYAQGLPFSTGQFFSTGNGFLFTPTLDVVSAASEGSNSIVIDESRWPDALTYGKVFGIGRGVYLVNDLERTGSLIEVEFGPPLRRDVVVDEIVSLRPSLICRPASPREFIALFQLHGLVSPGAITMTEVIDEGYL